MNEKITEHMKWYYDHGYITARDGNACFRINKSTFSVTASGVRKNDLSPIHILLVNNEGQTVEESAFKPSIETPGHIAALKASGKRASVHVHSPNSTAFYSMTKPMLITWPELDRYTKVGKTIPYLSPGSKELHSAIGKAFLAGCDIVVLKNHGVLAVGDSLEECQEHIHRLEHTTEIWLKMLSVKVAVQED